MPAISKLKARSLVVGKYWLEFFLLACNWHYRVKNRVNVHWSEEARRCIKHVRIFCCFIGTSKDRTTREPNHLANNRTSSSHRRWWEHLWAPFGSNSNYYTTQLIGPRWHHHNSMGQECTRWASLFACIELVNRQAWCPKASSESGSSANKEKWEEYKGAPIFYVGGRWCPPWRMGRELGDVGRLLANPKSNGINFQHNNIFQSTLWTRKCVVLS